VNETVTIRRNLPVDVVLARGVIQELATTGAWSGLSEQAEASVALTVRDAGAGASTIEVSQPVGQQPIDDVRAGLEDAVRELEHRLISRTSDAC
jgi:hypothetical protein